MKKKKREYIYISAVKTTVYVNVSKSLPKDLRLRKPEGGSLDKIEASITPSFPSLPFPPVEAAPHQHVGLCALPCIPRSSDFHLYSPETSANYITGRGLGGGWEEEGETALECM